MPSRNAHPSAGSAKRSRHNATATARLVAVWTTIAVPITLNTAASNAVPMLKWLVVPRHACTAMAATSRTNTTAVVQPTTRFVRRQAPR